MSKTTLMVLVGMALLIGACAGDASAEIESLAAERDELAGEVVQLETDNDALAGRVSELQAELEVELERVRGEAEAARGAAEAAEARAAEAEATAEELRLRYDPEIRTELQAAYDAEVARACTDAEERWQTSISSIVRWDPDWSPIATQADLIATIEECAAEERSKTAEEREAERLASCERIDADAVEKDPDSFTGMCVHMYVEIVQFDANTGRCSFRGEMSSVRSTSWLDYDGNAIFITESDSVCPELDGIDNDDFVEIWAIGAGSLTYDTTIGGSATAVLWDIERIELVQKG